MDDATFITQSFEETQRMGEEFARNSLGKKDKAMVVALYADLGGGKTTFVQGMAKGLGIKKRLISPTFILLREYKINNKELGFMSFYHIDLYRLEDEKQIEGLGIKEILDDPQNVVAIEWAERMGSLLPEKRIDIKFEQLEEDKRKIKIQIA